MAISTTLMLLPTGNLSLFVELGIPLCLLVGWQGWQWFARQRTSLEAQHSDRFQQAQQLNQQLEKLVQERTRQLQLAHDFEASLKRITDRVRDSLDEDQILQTAVQELTTAVGALGCNAAVYNVEELLSTIRYEYTTICVLNGRVLKMANFIEAYQQLLDGQYFQFCSLQPNPERGRTAMLACPMQDDQGVLGDLWLVHQPDYAFTEQDIRLMQQVANQCAIAIRQARLYQTAQAQVHELERLNALKDDFLSTVSHELRTPISNVKMAIQMLEMALNEQMAIAPLPDTGNPAGNQDLSSVPVSPAWNLKPIATKVDRYFQILKDECHREIELINDLLDLSRLDANSEPLALETIDLLDWIPKLTKPFAERALNQHQKFAVELPDHLPPLTTEFSSIDRILTELLNNACKYTPTGETIGIRCWIVDEGWKAEEEGCCTPSSSLYPLPSTPNSPPTTPYLFQIEVSNSGARIPAEELSRIFDKFYRIPKNDPWKYGGTGLGLALVKKLVERLHGDLQVNSSDSMVTFTVKLRSLLLDKTQ